MNGDSVDVSVVSGDETFVAAAGQLLQSAGYNVQCWGDVAQVFAKEKVKVDVIVASCDADQAQRLLLKTPDGCKVILVSDDNSCSVIAVALKYGAYDYLHLPMDECELVEAVKRAAADERGDVRLPQKAAEAMQFEESYHDASIETVQALVRAVEAKDPFTRKHSDNVAHYAKHFTTLLGMSNDQARPVRVAALLHDVGMIGVPDDVLVKAGELNENEFEHIRRHPALGSNILEQIGVFCAESHLVRYHHERWDGMGYPAGLSGEESPLGSRVIFIADSIDAMLMPRTYRNAYPVERMLDELARCAGRQFDPTIAAKVLQWCDSHRDELILPQVHAPIEE